MKKEIFILLILSMLIFSFCPTGVRQIDVPAVVGGASGGSLAIQVSVEPGEGNIYTSVYPKTGISTQSSEENAVISSFLYSNKSLDECTIHFDVINTLNSKFVDGPSAGVAMAVATSAVLQNKELRQDAVITGTIDKNGNIGTVGGISEKTTSAAISGKKYFLTTIPSVRYKIISAALEDLGHIKMVDVRTLEEAIEIFFQPTGSIIEKEPNPLENTKIPENLTSIIKNENLEKFSDIGNSMVDKFEIDINEYSKIIGKNSSRYEFIDYFNKEIDIQRELLDKGYVFTAANNIFLQEIDFEFLKRVGEIDLELEQEEANTCIDSLDLFNKTENNWQWISGSEMRLNWAEDKLNSLPLFSEKRTEGEEYPYLYEILYSKSWCNIAKNLNKKDNGNIINESNLETYAKNKILLEQDYITKQPEINSESLRHLRTAQEAFNKKQYITAIYDASFAHSLQEASSDSFYSKDIESLADAMYKEKNKSSLWGQLYLTQAQYIYESGDKEGSYTIFMLSDKFESTTAEIEEEFVKEIEDTSKNKEKPEENKVDYMKFIWLLSGLIVLESILLIYSAYLQQNTK